MSAKRSNRKVRRLEGATATNAELKQRLFLASIMPNAHVYDLKGALRLNQRDALVSQIAEQKQSIAQFYIRPPHCFSSNGRLMSRRTLRTLSSAFHPDGYLFAAGDLRSRIHIWTLEDMGTIEEIQSSVETEHPSQLPISSIQWMSDAPKLFTGACCDKTVPLWDIVRQTVVHFIPLPDDQVFSAMSVSGNTLVTATQGDFGKSGLLTFDVRTPCTTPVNEIYVDSVVNTVKHVDSDIILCGDRLGSLSMWNLQQNPYIPMNKIEASPGYPIASVAASGDLIGVNSYDNRLRIFEMDVRGLKCVKTFRGGLRCGGWPIACDFLHRSSMKQSSSRRALDIDPEDSYSKGPPSTIVASGSTDGCVYIWGLKGSHGYQDILEVDHAQVLSICFHPSQPILTTASVNSKIKLWMM